ncbi:MAG: GIY-YIG nuclease family protein [Clostridia bacterium]|nr:GIY-YIG nuclease family protein [Clostridia bacterium]
MKQEAEERRALEQERRRIENEEAKFKAQIEEVQSKLSTASDSENAALKARLLELEAQLYGVVQKKEEIANLQNGKAGNVYIISNLGSFGEDVFKIGMTRRLDPQERVDELGSASVPFGFDVHSFIFSDDAVALENELHRRLDCKRVNRVNPRKEFFKISLDELEELTHEISPTAEFRRTMAAEEYRQSLSVE